MDRCILVIGNLSDGFRFEGPFETFDDADIESRDYSNETVWIATLDNPKHYAATGTAEDCERIMRELSNGERGCTNPKEHRE